MAKFYQIYKGANLRTAMLKTIMCFFVYFGLIAAAAAQRYTFKNYTTHDGLVQTEITDIAQDRRGAIWIGTKGGLSVFDGKTFTNYDDHDLLQSLFINGLFCDSAGVMWVATENGLLRYENGFTVFFKAPLKRAGWVNNLTANSRNVLLFVSDHTVYSVNGTKAERYAIGKPIDDHVAFLAFDRADNLWIVTEDMKVYKKTANALISVRTPFTAAYKRQGFGLIKLLGKQGPSPCFVTNFGSFWVMDDSLCSFAGLHPSFPDAKVGAATFVLQEGDSTLWAGGTVGLAKLAANGATRFAAANGFCDNSVSCLFTDREKNLWVGCTYNGVYKLANEALFSITPPDQSVDLRHVSAASQLPAGGLLLGTWGKGLFLVNGDSVSKVSALSPVVRYITCLLATDEKTYIGWFGRGLWQMDHRTQKISLVPSFATDEMIGQVYKAGNDFVIQTLGDVGYVTDASFRPKARRELPDDYSIKVLNNRIYGVSNTGRTDVLNDKLQVIQPNVFPQIGSRITALTGHGDYLLVGTFGQGLFVYDAGGRLVRRLDKKSGLGTNIVTALLADGSRLFIGSNLGLLRADLPDIQNVKTFTESEGMFSWECRPGGLKELADGSILIATTNGPYLYHPAKDGQPATGQLSLVDFRYGTTHAAFPVTATDMKLSQPVAYKDNAITVTLQGISQRAPDDVVYHYQLQGDDPVWIATADPVITFDDLAPGAYNLKAYITIGSFTSKPLSVKFSVDKPLSGKLWFQALLVLALSGLCWGLLTVGNRIYQRYVQSKTMDRLERNISLKQQLTTGSVLLTKDHLGSLQAFLKDGHYSDVAAEVATMFLSDAGKRIEWLWQRETVTVGEMHGYFDELASGYGSEAKIYHKQTAAEINLPITEVFPLVQLFSLYLITALHQDKAAVFGLDSETRTDDRLLLRFYTLTPVTASHKLGMYHFLKEAVDKQKAGGVTVDVIENLAFGNMLVAEVNL